MQCFVRHLDVDTYFFWYIIFNPRMAFGILIYQAHSLPEVWHNPKLLYTKLIVSVSATQLEQHTQTLGGLGRSYSHLGVGRAAHSQCGK